MSTLPSSLRVMRGRTQIATLDWTAIGTAYQYSKSFLTKQPGPRDGLGFAHPPHPDRVEHGPIHPYFANLLPEGPRQQRVAEALGLRPDDAFGWLAAMEGSSTGDVWALAENASPAKETKLELPDRFLFHNLREQIRHAKEHATQSIAGVHAKLTNLRIATDPHTASKVPYGFAGTAAILKFGSPETPHLAENEAFFMDLAKRAGFKTAKSCVLRDASGESALLVIRFDRGPRGLRVHQEDACQLLGLHPYDRYNVSLREVVEAFQRVCASPMAAALEVIAQAAFAYLVGNTDLHAKNFSVLLSPKTGLVEPSPVYDVVSTLLYSPHEARMALAMDGRDTNLNREDFLAFAESFGVRRPALEARLNAMTAVMPGCVDRILDLPFDPRTLKRWRDEARLRTESLST